MRNTEHHQSLTLNNVHVVPQNSTMRQLRGEERRGREREKAAVEKLQASD